jgi:hypothetical protein
VKDYGPTNREVSLPAEYAGRVPVGAETIARLRFPTRPDA